MPFRVKQVKGGYKCTSPDHKQGFSKKPQSKAKASAQCRIISKNYYGEDRMATQVQESLEVMEILAAFDPHAFKVYTESTTPLKVIPMQERDPLNKQAMGEDVEVLAAMIDREQKLGPYEGQLKQMAHDYGYFLA